MAISFANVFNAVIGVMALSRMEMSYAWIYPIMAVNFGLPIIALIVGWQMNKARKRRRAAEGKLVGKPVDSTKMAKQRRLVERNINEYTLRFLVSWTSVVVICSCLAAELIFIGQFEKLVLTDVWAHTEPSQLSPSMESCAREDEIRRLEFVGYGTWKGFTESCCCMSRASDSNTSDFTSQFTELWMCRNTTLGRDSVSYKERQRRDIGSLASDGWLVRPFCGTNFIDSTGSEVPGLEPYWDAASERLQVDLKMPNGTVVQTVPEYW